MPIYSHLCNNGHTFDLYLKFSELEQPQFCVCGTPAERLISTPMIFVKQDICYLSPIDGKPITSKQARQDDLARSGCVEYDPCVRQDHDRNLVEQEKNLDKIVDESVEREVALMPSRKKERLFAEIEGGMTVEPTRGTHGT